MEDRAREEKDKEVLKELLREEDKAQRMLDLQKEARKMKNRCKDKKKANAEEKKKQEQQSRDKNKNTQVWDCSGIIF